MITASEVVKDIVVQRALRAAHAYEIEIAKHRASHVAALAAIIDYGNALREGRKGRSNNAFHDWIKDNGIDRIKPFDEQQERTAAMSIAEIVQGTTTLDRCLHNRPTNIMTWWRAQQRAKNIIVAERRPRRNKVVEIAKAIKAETGEWPGSKTLADAAHVHSRNADNALREAKAAEVAAVEAEAKAKAETEDTLLSTQATYTKAQQKHVDAAIRRHLREVDKAAKMRELAFEERVRAEASSRFIAAKEAVFPRLQERENSAFKREETYRKMIDAKAIFTEAEFGNIRFCLHPDNSASEEKRRSAFTTFNLKKMLLTGKE